MSVTGYRSVAELKREMSQYEYVRWLEMYRKNPWAVGPELWYSVGESREPVLNQMRNMFGKRIVKNG